MKKQTLNSITVLGGSGQGGVYKKSFYGWISDQVPHGRHLLRLRLLKLDYAVEVCLTYK